MRTIILGCILLLIAPKGWAQQPTWETPPKLVVGIVVDQMRLDHLYRYWDNFGGEGFKRMVREGALLRNTHYNYVPTYTAPGHASIYTGTTPSRHGIVANDTYQRDRGTYWYCVKDSLVRPVGTTSDKARRSPHQLLASTLADELELRTDRGSKTIGVALKDRSAIMSVGRTADAAYWFIGGHEGKFATSSWYMDGLPAWLEDFNAKELAKNYMEQRWELALPRSRYHLPLPDDNPYERSLAKELPPTLPLDLAALKEEGASYNLLTYTPWGNTLTTDLALAAIAGEQLGQDALTDLLAISYSSTDMLGHRTGPRSLEIEDMFIRLDREVARLLAYLDAVVGEGAYTVFLTADHGGADVPAYLRDLKASAGYLSMAGLEAWLHERGPGAWVAHIGQGQVYLKPGAPEGTAARVAAELNRHPGIAMAFEGLRLLGQEDGTGLAAFMAKGYVPERCGDVLFQMRPGFLEEEYGHQGKGTSHGSAWNYDTHVPLIFMGQGVRRGEVLRQIAITDIAPTMSAIIGMSAPNAADGQVVPEVVAY